MKINLPPQAFTVTKKQARRLRGEPRDFTPKRSDNLTPPQHLEPGGAITSTRDQEVSTQDSLWLEVNRLKAVIKEAIDTLPDNTEPLDNNAACDIAWVKARLEKALHGTT